MIFKLVPYFYVFCVTICLGYTNDVRFRDRKTQELDAIQQVFGSSQVPAQAPNQTLVDPDYWDRKDDFKPSVLQYDNFDWTLTKIVSGNSDGNVLLSPLSLKLALAILDEAATGVTKTEIETVVGFPLIRQELRQKFSLILESLHTKTNQYILDLGSRIYVGPNVHPRQMFSAIAEDFYKTEIKNIDLDHPQNAVIEANAWIANVTHNRINNLIAEGDLDGVVMMILNTIYFMGTWRHQFSVNDTREGAFYLQNLQTTGAYFMTQKNKFFYAESAYLDSRILRLPYLGRKFSMYILLPNSINGVDKLLTDMNAFQLRKELFLLQERTVSLTLPRLQFEFVSHLENILKDLGIRQAFEDLASFPGISRGQTLDKRLKVSTVLQKSGIEINELGSTAYTATEISLINKFGDGEEIVEFLANRPFVFYIEDELTRQVLFSGKIVNPAQPNGLVGAPRQAGQ